MKQTLARSLGCVAFGAAISLAGCNGGGSSNNPSSYPNCTAPGNFQAVYPINGATNVPDGTQVVYVASSVALGSQYQNVIQPPGGGAYAGNLFTQVPLSQVPTPRATPSFSNPIYYQTAVGTLSSASTWTFFLNNTNSANCVPVQYLTFTTQ
jgi:hypothetical protein